MRELKAVSPIGVFQKQIWLLQGTELSKPESLSSSGQLTLKPQSKPFRDSSKDEAQLSILCLKEGLLVVFVLRYAVT